MDNVFVPSKYTNWYFSIINRAKTRTLEGYGENHHIIPKSCDGSNEKDNLVRLTAKEHFVCHHILTKIMARYDHEQKMVHAFWRLVHGKTTKQFVTARIYNECRQNIRHRKESNQLNRLAHLGKKASGETKRKMSEQRQFEKHPMSKAFVIENVKNQTKQTIFCLSKWCKENNLDYGRIKASMHKGFTTRDGWKVQHA